MISSTLTYWILVKTCDDDDLSCLRVFVPEEFEAPPTPPFVLPFPGELPPIPPVPTSPPMPPKRRISVPLEPPKLKQKPFVDPSPVLHPKAKGVSSTLTSTSDSSGPRYAELRKKPDFFLELASAALKCLFEGIVISQHNGVRKMLQDKMKSEFVSQLAWLVMNVGATGDSARNPTPVGRTKRGAKKARLSTATSTTSSVKQNLSKLGLTLMEAVHEMIVNDPGRHLLHDVLLHELGLTAKCWSLSIPPTSLSVLARVLVCRLYLQPQEEAPSEDDPLALAIWRG